MKRYHLFYKGTGPKPQDVIAMVRSMPGVQIVNDTLPRSVVVDVSGQVAEERLRRLPYWSLQQSHPVKLGATTAESSLNKSVPPMRLLVKA